MSKKVVTLGEIMLRLSTPDYKRFVQADSFDVTYAVAKPMWWRLLPVWINEVFISKVPDNLL